MMYDGFISYSHAADDLLAPRLQSALQRFAKPWWKRRAVRIFRDESSLSANPHLWSSITEALDASGWFVLLLSPDAARSEWVNQEIAYWVENRDPKKILPVVTDGAFGWDDGDVSGGAVPEALRGVFSEEPRWVDLRFAKDEEQLDLNNPTFSAAVADIASAIRGVPKDELESEEVRQHRRTVRTAWAGIGLIAMLSVAAIWFGVAALRNAAEAQQNELTALARQYSSEAARLIPTDPELATMLALQAVDVSQSGGFTSPEAIDALSRASQADRFIASIDTGYDGWTAVDVSSDGSRIAVSSENGATLQLYDESFELLWEAAEDSTDTYARPLFSPNGDVVVQPVIDLRAAASSRDPLLADDDLPNRLLVRSVDSGELVHTIDFAPCRSVEVGSFSPDGRFFAIGSGLEGCERRGSIHWMEVFDTSSWSAVAFLPHPHREFGGPIPEFGPEGRLFLFGWPELQVYGPETFEQIEAPTQAGPGMPLRNDNTFALEVGAEIQVIDMESGAVSDRLGRPDEPVRLPYAFAVSDSGRWLAVGTDGPYTTLFDLGAGDSLRLRTGSTFNLAIDDANNRLFASTNRGVVTVWDLSDDRIGVEEVGGLPARSWVLANTITVSDKLGAVAIFDVDSSERSVWFFRLDTLDWVGQPIAGQRAIALQGDRFVVDRGLDWVAVDPSEGEILDFISCPAAGAQLCGTSDGSIVFDLASTDDPGRLVVYRERLDAGSDGVSDTLDQNGRLIDAGRWDGSAFLIDGDGGFDSDLVGDPAIGVPTDDPIVFWHDYALVRKTQTAQLVDRATGDVVWSADSFILDFSIEGRAIAYVSNGALARLDLDTLEVSELAMDLGGVNSLQLDERSDRVAIGTADGLIVADLELGAITYTALIPDVTDAHWIDDERLIVGTSRGLWGTASIDVESLINEVRSRIRRGFTDAECATYRIESCPDLDDLRRG